MLQRAPWHTYPRAEEAVSVYERARLTPLGDCAVVVSFGDDISEAINLRVRAFSSELSEATLPALVEGVPAFTNVTILYDPLITDYEGFAAALESLIDRTPTEPTAVESRTVEIPVCYGGEFGPDLGFVAAHNDVSEDEVIAIHTEPDYRVYMIGFAPGFPYLGGMSTRIAAPRRDSPRAAIPAGSVGIAGHQTGVYPIETPGGWQLIGRTPLRLFRAERETPSLMQAGDRVRFHAISRAQFERE
jgi:inhibitor of KinA